MMVPTIEPTVIVPVGESLQGHAPFMQLQFAGDPPALFVYESTYDYPWYRVLQWHAPTIAAVVLVIVVLVVLVKAWRVWRRPMADGLLYCRGCNHELGAPNAERVDGHVSRWMSEDARCPECGVRTERSPRVGVSGWKRLRWTLLGGVVLLAGSVTTLCLTLRPYPAAWRFALEPTWPVKGLEKRAGIFTLVRKMSITDRQGVRISRIDLPNGEQRELLKVWRPGLNPLYVSKDGRWLVVSDGRRWDTILLVEAATAETRQIQLPIAKNRSAELVAFSTDSKRAYLSSRDWQSRDKEICVLFCLELATGVVQEIDMVEVKHSADWLDRTSSGSMFAVRDDEKGLSWVHHQNYGKAGAQLDVFRRLQGDKIEEIEFKDLNFRGENATLSSDRDVVEFHDLRRTSVRKVDLKTKRSTNSGLGAMPLPKRRYLNWPSNGLLVRNWSQQEPLAILSAPLSEVAWGIPHLSGDGRWLAAYVTRSTVAPAPGATVAPGKSIYEIRVWDLNKVPDVRPASESGGSTPGTR